MEVNCHEREIDFVKRTGNKGGKSRPLLVGLASSNLKMEIMRSRGKLKGSNIFLEDDMPKLMVEERKKLAPVVKELIKRNKRCLCVEAGYS